MGTLKMDRVIGVAIGAAVGDALGAPFEFGPAGAFSRQFPTAARGLSTEMCGGGSFAWEPGEWTDDTQTALHLAASLLTGDTVDEGDAFDRLLAWFRSGPADVGNQTRRVLSSGRAWDQAADADLAAGHLGGGNGALMRTWPAALRFLHDLAASEDAARRLARITHADPDAVDCSVLLHRLIHRLVHDEAVEDIVSEVRGRWGSSRDPNGTAWVTLVQAVDALEATSSPEECLRAVIDLGGDTDTVASVAGALAGAKWGVQAFPSRWTTAVHGAVPGDPRPVATDSSSLQHLAIRLVGGQPAPFIVPEPAVAPEQIAEGLWVSNIAGAVGWDGPLISLCRPDGLQPTRSARLVDQEDRNPALDFVVADILADIEALRAEGQRVLVHCHGGRSRTGLILRAWLQQTQGLSYDEARARAIQLWPMTSTYNTEFEDCLQRRGNQP